MKNNLIKVGISQGDTNGVGLELIIRTFAEESIFQYCTPVVYASPKAFAYYKKLLNLEKPVYNQIQSAADAVQGKLNLVVTVKEGIDVQPGTASNNSGKEALMALNAMLEDASKGLIDAMVTAPLDKNSVAANEINFTGHTGYIAKYFNVQDYAMLLVSDEVKVALVTEHLPVSDVAKNLTKELIYNKIQTLHACMKQDFGLVKPKIAVLGLNPHAGDNGLLGKEEKEVIIPAIEKCFSAGHLVFGPYPADSFFGSGQFRQFDAVLAMYHDQGLIPFKTFAFYEGVNYTAGLPVLRTSPDHGTAYSLAGKGTADLQSFRNAIFEAIHIVRNRRQHADDYANPLPYSELKREKFRIDF